MSGNQGLLNRLEELLRQKKSKRFYAEKLGISEEEVNKLLKELKKQDRSYLKNEIELLTKKVNNDKGTIESITISDFEPKNDIELSLLHKIDLDKYVITNYWSKILPSGKFTSSVFCKRKQPKDYTPEDFLNFLKDFTPDSTPLLNPVIDKLKEHVNVELSISDYHLAKKHIDEDNDPKIRADRYFNIAETLINKVISIYNVDTIVLPISNDFFHTDNYQNQTTNGTPQDVIMNYAEEYEVGFSLLVKTIIMLKQKCSNVEIVLVQGNHDRTKSFYLAHALEVFFRDNFDISFRREHDVVQGLTLGNTFIGWHHGNCKIEDLPLLFATHPKYSKQFGYATFREIHTGDKHHYMAKEIKGVRIQQMPSLSGTDRWHLDNNYVHSIRAALALVYDYKFGKVCEFETRI